jgi:hypothetical protein|nr:MAG TPA: hypothetical protein [Caudoviricetes sp.]
MIKSGGSDGKRQEESSLPAFFVGMSKDILIFAIL